MANIKEHILEQTDILLDYLDGLKTKDSVPFTEQEVQDILATERDAAQKNYNNAIAAFLESNNQTIAPKVKRFAVYWGYPGAGKSVMTQKLIERFSRDEDCLPFNIIDKDNHRDLFPHLFDHLKGGHIDECERFAGVTIDYVRTILDLSLKAGQRSVLSIGSMGAGVEFKDNAQKAISHGYKPCAVYMAVNKDIAYLSNIYRSANLLLYDSRKPHEVSVKDVIIKEENRMLTPQEVTTLNMQLYKIKQNMKYRYDNKVYAPCKSEVIAAKIAVSNVHKLIEERYDGRISGGITPLTPMMRFASEFGKAI